MSNYIKRPRIRAHSLGDNIQPATRGATLSSLCPKAETPVRIYFGKVGRHCSETERRIAVGEYSTVVGRRFLV